MKWQWPKTMRLELTNCSSKIILQLSFTKKSLLSATSILSRSPIAYNTTVSLDKLSCTNYGDFDKWQDKFGHFSSSKKDSNYLDVEFKVLKEADNEEFRLVQNFTMGEEDFNQFIGLRNQLVTAAENFAREENLSPVLILTLPKHMDEQLKVAHKIADVPDRTNRKVFVTLLQYNVDRPESSLAQVHLWQ